MTRMIDADDMIKSLMDMTFYDEEGHMIDDYEDRLAIVKSFVDPVQTVDAEPIRHARLVNASPYGECSYCGELIDSRDRFRYCPHCGARLVGE